MVGKRTRKKNKRERREKRERKRKGRTTKKREVSTFSKLALKPRDEFGKSQSEESFFPHD